MMQKRLLELLDIILKYMLGVTKSRYKKGLRNTYGGPIPAVNFYSKDVIEPIEMYSGEGDDPLTNETMGIIDEAIYKYFDGDLFRYNRVKATFKVLEKRNFINTNPLVNKDSFNKLAVAEVLVRLWHYNYERFCNGDEFKTFNIDKYLHDLAKTNLIAKLEVEDYQEALKVIDRIRLGDMKKEPDTVDMIYKIFIEKFIDSDTVSMTGKEFNAFIELVYYMCDIFDYTNDVRSYNLQAVALNSISVFYEDDFTNLDKDNIRRIIGFIYGIAIAVKHGETNSEYYIKLSKHNNIVTTKEKTYEDKQDEESEKLKICFDAMKSISGCKYLKTTRVGTGLRNSFLEDNKKLSKAQKFPINHFEDDLLYKLETAALWASDMAAIGKINSEKGIDENNRNLRNAKRLHKYCGETRQLLIEVYKTKHDICNDAEEKVNYKSKKDELTRRYAKTLSNLTGIKEVEGDYIEAIVDRCILHRFFESVEAKTLAKAELSHLESTITKLKTQKLNEYKFGIDYSIAFLPVFTDKQIKEMYPEVSKSEAKDIVSSANNILKKSKSTINETAFSNYIKKAKSIFDVSNVTCLEKEIRNIFDILLRRNNNELGDGMNAFFLLGKKDKLSSIIKDELDIINSSESQRKDTKKSYKKTK